MSTYLAFHRCTNVRLSHTYADNANSVVLVIVQDGTETEVTFYDLPSHVTDKFNAFRDELTVDYRRNSQLRRPPTMVDDPDDTENETEAAPTFENAS